MEAVVDVSHGVDLTICLTANVKAETVVVHKFDVVRYILFCHVLVKRDDDTLFNAKTSDIRGYAEDDIRNIIGVHDHV